MGCSRNYLRTVVCFPLPIALLILLSVAATSASASTKWQWRVQGQQEVFSTREAAETSFSDINPEFAIYTQSKLVGMSDDRVVYEYSAPSVVPEVQSQWRYYFDNNWFDSESATMDAVLEGYDGEKCPGSWVNSSTDWKSDGDFLGVSNKEKKYLEMGYYLWARWGNPPCFESGSNTHILRTRSVVCPTYYVPDTGANLCVNRGIVHVLSEPVTCSATVGNPCEVATGAKLQRETDYQSPELRFVRNYNSLTHSTGSHLGNGWRHNYSARLIIVSGSLQGVLRPNGTHEPFKEAQPGSGIYASQVTAGRYAQYSGGSWVVFAGNGRRLVFNVDGVLQTIKPMEGPELTLHYDAQGRLTRVQTAYGKTLTLDYMSPSGALSKLTLPDGSEIEYAYDAKSNLVSVQYPDDSSRQFLYENTDFPHHLTGIVDANGNRYATYAYDDLGRAISTQHAGGANHYTLNYSADSTLVHDAAGKITTYEFTDTSAFRKIKQVHNAQSVSVKAYSADVWRRLISETDKNGNITNYQYDSRGLEVSRTEGAGASSERTITTQWHPDYPLPVKITDADRITEYTYDGNGNRLSETVSDATSGQSRTNTWTYNAYGQMITEDGPRTDVSDVTTYEYDAAGNLTRLKNALGQVTVLTDHDAHGKPRRVVGVNGVVTELDYDLRQRLIRRTVAVGLLPDQATTIFDYDAAGQLVKVTPPDGAFVNYQYDSAHRLIAMSDAMGSRMDYRLDAMGNRVREAVFRSSGTLTREQERDYNTLNRIVADINGVEERTQYAYDAAGNRTRVTDASSTSTDFTYDALDRLTGVTDALDGETTYAYGPLGSLTQVTDPNDHTTNYTHNGFGEVTQLTSPDTGTTTYEYDAAGNRTAQVDARGVRTEYTYDALNRLTQVHYPSDPSLDVIYTYDQGTNGIGRLTRLDDATGYTTYTYDAWGNVISQTQVTDGNTYTVTYGYNLDNQLESITYPSGQVVTYSFDDVGNISGVSSTSGGATSSLASGIGYLPFGPAEQWTLGNGLIVSRDFDLDYRLTGVTTTPVIDYSYAYDPVGNIIAWDNLLDASRSQTFDYDVLDRLTDATGVYGDFDYSYDPVGNRLSKTKTAGSANSTDTYSYDPTSNRLAGITGGTTESIGYDAVGNIVSRGSDTFTYNVRNRMAQVKRGGSVIAAYQHNGKGERVIKTAGGNTTHFVYDLMGNIIAEADSTGAIQREYVYVNGERLALLQQSPTQATYYYHNDHLGTPKALTNASGTVVWQADYTPFGELTETVSIVEQPFRFPGQYYDGETGLYYNYFRDYDPGLGRYVQSDPIGLDGGLNTYSYVRGNPVSRIDPLGLVEWSGTFYQIGGGYRGATAAKYIFTLTSACVDGKQAKIQVDATGYGLGLGALPVSNTGGQLSFEDGLSQLDPTVFNGTFFAMGASFSWGIGGSYSGIRLGSATSSGGDLIGGVDASVSEVTGTSTVQGGVEMIDCGCE